MLVLSAHRVSFSSLATSLLVLLWLVISPVNLWANELVTAPSGPKNILVSVRPYALILESLIQNGDQVSVLVEAGTSAHDFQLRPSHLRKIEQADLVIWGGEYAEPFLAKVLSDKKSSKKNLLTIIDIEGLDLITSNHVHQHEDHADFSHEAFSSKNHTIQQNKQKADHHFWFSQHNAILIAKAMAEALNYSQATVTEFQNSFPVIDKTHTSKNNTNNALIVYHNAYLYLEESLGLEHDFVIRESHNSKPSLRHWQKLSTLLKQYQKKEQSICVLTMPGYEYSSEAKQFEKIWSNVKEKTDMKNNLAYIELDPLASDFSDKNYMSFLQGSKNKIQQCMEK